MSFRSASDYGRRTKWPAPRADLLVSAAAVVGQGHYGNAVWLGLDAKPRDIYDELV
jgi:hypothetical protein